MKIVIVTSGYPNEHNQAQNIFVKKLVDEMADQGQQCYVISPQNRLHKELPFIEKERTDITIKGNSVKVYFPSFYTGWRTEKYKYDIIPRLGKISFRNAVNDVIESKVGSFDYFYAHFLNPAGTCVATLKKKYGVKAFCAFGESSFWSLGKYRFHEKCRELATLDGIVAVSTDNMQQLLKENIFPKEKMVVIPNATDLSIYHPYEKRLARKEFGFNQNDFIVSFVGSLIERKGVLRLTKALEDVEGVKIALAGKGEQEPKASNIIYCGPVAPDKIPVFLSASNVFVLPTLNEGCCNAIVEAMACGVAIVSSDLPFNYDILNYNNSLMIDPNSVDDIRNAVLRLRDDPEFRDRMANQAYKDAQELGIEARTNRILDFMTSY